MLDNSEYELIDFGDGRKLERFGDIVLDRPSPSADAVAKKNAAAWENAHARYVRINPARDRSRETFRDEPSRQRRRALPG